MKKKFLVGIFALVLFISMVTAFWPFTGNAVGARICEGSEEPDRYTQGSIDYINFFGEFHKVDECIGTKRVREYWCSNGRQRSRVYACQNCSNGACIEEQTPEEQNSCEDSDGGVSNEATIAGLANEITSLSGSYRRIVDSCINNYTLKEAICKDNRVSSKIIKCKEDAAGKCQTKEINFYKFKNDKIIAAKCTPQPESCIDSNPSEGERGSVVVVDIYSEPKTYWDKCNFNGRLLDYSCNSSQLISKEISCPEGETCNKGVCVSALCTDSDNGKVYNVPGETSTEYGIFSDVCLDDNTVLEGYCQLTQKAVINVKNQKCKLGCVGGVCVSSTENPNQENLGEKCSVLMEAMQQAYNSECGEYRYDKRADFNNDKKIDFQDVAPFSGHSDNELWCQEQIDKTTNPCS